MDNIIKYSCPRPIPSFIMNNEPFFFIYTSFSFWHRPSAVFFHKVGSLSYIFFTFSYNSISALKKHQSYLAFPCSDFSFASAFSASIFDFCASAFAFPASSSACFTLPSPVHCAFTIGVKKQGRCVEINPPKSPYFLLFR